MKQTFSYSQGVKEGISKELGRNGKENYYFFLLRLSK